MSKEPPSAMPAVPSLPLCPPLVAIKLARIAVHADEYVDVGSRLDAMAIKTLVADQHVGAYIEKLADRSLVPVRRDKHDEG